MGMFSHFAHETIVSKTMAIFIVKTSSQPSCPQIRDCIYVVTRIEYFSLNAIYIAVEVCT